MLIYTIKRIVVFIPTLLIICILAFFINKITPGDPVNRLLTGESDKPENRDFYDIRYQQVQHQLGLDLPVFYFSISSMAESDTIYKVTNSQHRQTLKLLTIQFGNWQYISNYYQLISKTKQNTGAIKLMKYDLEKLLKISNVSEIDAMMKCLIDNSKIYPDFKNDLLNIVLAWHEVKWHPTSWKNYIPVIHFYSHNQFHRWLFGDGNTLTGENALYTRGIIRGDFGKSFITGKSVSRQLLEKTGFTVFFSLSGILIAFLISIPIGVKAGSNIGSFFDKWSSRILALLYAVPAFFLATLLIMLFANPDMLKWFPSSGVAPAAGFDKSVSLWKIITTSMPYFILPMICYTYGSLAFLSRAIRTGVQEEMKKAYILTARAKGLEEKEVIWNHAFRNALFPLITILAYVLPGIIGGSVILETIFSIPGLGSEIISAIFNQDYPVIMAVFMITGFLTMIGYLLADILYSIADPRINLKA